MVARNDGGEASHGGAYAELMRSLAVSHADLVKNLYPDLTKSVAVSFEDMTRRLYPNLSKSLLPSYSELLKGLFPGHADLAKGVAPSFTVVTEQMFGQRAESLLETLDRRWEELDETDKVETPAEAPDPRVPVAPWRLTERQWSLLRLGAVAFLAADAAIYSKLENVIGEAASPAELLWWSAGLSFVLMLMVVDFYDRHGPDSN